MRGPAYSDAMPRAVKPIQLQTRAVAVIVLALTALACLASFAPAGMGMASGQDCFGPACPQQVTCARADQAPAAPSRPLVASLAIVGFSVPAAWLLQGRMLPPTTVPPSRRSVSPLASRSPPAA
jgi:hypothetical protein